MAKDSFWDLQVDSTFKPGRLAQITPAMHTIADKCLNVNPGEKYAIITDTETSPLLTNLMAGMIAAYGAEVVQVTIPQLPYPSAEPSDMAGAAMNEADVFINMCTRTISHTEVRNEAQYEHDSDYFLLPAQTEDSFIRGSITADPYEVRKRTEAVTEALDDAREVHVESDDGTDVTFSLEGRPPKMSQAFLEEEKGTGAIATWPSGETPVLPIHEGMNGTVVVDSFMMGVGLLEDPIIWEIEDGTITSIEGGDDAKELQRIIDEKGDENSYKIGEFSVGTNPNARVMGKPFEDKEVEGSVHFALGTGIYYPPYYEPDYRSSLHLDGVLNAPTITVDGERIVDEGSILIYD